MLGYPHECLVCDERQKLIELQAQGTSQNNMTKKH